MPVISSILMHFASRKPLFVAVILILEFFLSMNFRVRLSTLSSQNSQMTFRIVSTGAFTKFSYLISMYCDGLMLFFILQDGIDLTHPEFSGDLQFLTS